MYKLHISNKAKKELRLITLLNREACLLALQDIKDEPLLGKPLTRNLSSYFSYRLGVYRIIYRVNQKDEVIEVLTVGHRSIVYN